MQPGETLSGIAGLYDITLDSLLAWNGLGVNSIIRPEQKLLLQVTPPATRTPTPGLPTARPAATATVTPTQLRPTPTPISTSAAPSPTAPAALAAQAANLIQGWPLPVVLIAAGLVLLVWLSRRNA